MDHPAPPSPDQVPAAAPERPDLPGVNRFGLLLFGIYLAIYVTFVGVAAFNGPVMAQRPFGGVDLAILAGFVLISAPLLLALVYLWSARKQEG